MNECSVPVPKDLILSAVVDVDNPATLNLLLSNLENTNTSGGMRFVEDPPMTWFVASIPTLVLPWLSYLIFSPAWNPWLIIVIVSELTVICLLRGSLGLNILLNKGTAPLCVVNLKELTPTIWPPVSVVIPVNWLLISSINSTFAVAILNKFLIFLFWKFINLDSPFDIVVSVAKSKSFLTKNDCTLSISTFKSVDCCGDLATKLVDLPKPAVGVDFIIKSEKFLYPAGWTILSTASVKSFSWTSLCIEYEKFW